MRTRRAGNGTRGNVRGADDVRSPGCSADPRHERSAAERLGRVAAAESGISELSGRAGLFLSAPAGAVAMIREIATRDRRQPGTEVPSSVTGTYVSCAKNEKLVEF